MNALLTCILALGFTLCAGQARACTCLGEDFYLLKDGWAVEILAAKSDVVLARVLDVLPDGSARIEIVKTLKGAGKVSTLVRGTTYPTCQISFTAGEKFVYLLDSSASVQLCNRLSPTSAMLQSLEEMLGEPVLEVGAPKQ